MNSELSLNSNVVDKSKSIVLITTSLGWGGTEGHVTDLVYGFYKRKISCIVIVDHPPLDRLQSVTSLGIEVIVIGINKSWSSSEYKRRLRKTLEEINPKLVHANIWERQSVIMETVHELSIPYIETIHATNSYKGKLWLLRHRLFITRMPLTDFRLYKAYKNYEPVIINISDISLNNFLIRYPFIRRSMRIYCGAYVPEFPNLVHLKEAAPKVLWIGTMITRKRPLLALKIWKQIVKNFSKAELIMVGNGPQFFKVKELAKEFPANSVRVCGSVKDLKPILQEGDIMFHTSSSEGIPKNIRYAMTFGIPVVSTDVGAISEVVDDGENGFLAEVNNFEKLEKKILELISNVELRKDMGRKARERGIELFDMDKMTNNVLDAYHKFHGVAFNTEIRGDLVSDFELD